MKMKIVAMANDFNEGNILIGKTIFGKYYKARFSDYNVSSVGRSAQRRIDINEFINTDDFDRVTLLSKQEFHEILSRYRMSGYR